MDLHDMYVGPPALNVDVISARDDCLFAETILGKCRHLSNSATALSTVGGNTFYDIIPSTCDTVDWEMLHTCTLQMECTNHLAPTISVQPHLQDNTSKLIQMWAVPRWGNNIYELLSLTFLMSVYNLKDLASLYCTYTPCSKLLCKLNLRATKISFYVFQLNSGVVCVSGLFGSLKSISDNCDNKFEPN